MPIATTTVTVEGHSGTDLTLSARADRRHPNIHAHELGHEAQTVTVTASHDDRCGRRPGHAHTHGEGPTGAYQDLTKTVMVTVDDDEETRVVTLSVTVDDDESLGPIDEGAVQSYRSAVTPAPTWPCPA